jgi:hypothetical protein
MVDSTLGFASKVTVIGDGSAERFAAALDRIAARLAQKGPDLPQR